MVSERIKEYIDYKGIKIAAFEKSIGMSNASFGKSLKNKGAIGSDKLENILSIYKDLSPEWLLTGRGSMLKTKSTSASLPSCEEPTPLSKDTNNITNKQDIIEKSNALVDPFLMLIRERDATIKEQAEEIGHLKEQIRQLTFEKEQLVSNAHSPTTASVG
jgi:hypothetical protein